MSVSWGDHLVFGEGDGKLDTPELLDSAINRWKENLDAGTILLRENRSRQDDYVFVAEGYEYAAKVHKNLPDFDDFEIAKSLLISAYKFAKEKGAIRFQAQGFSKKVMDWLPTQNPLITEISRCTYWYKHNAANENCVDKGLWNSSAIDGDLNL